MESIKVTCCNVSRDFRLHDRHFNVLAVQKVMLDARIEMELQLVGDPVMFSFMADGMSMDKFDPGTQLVFKGRHLEQAGFSFEYMQDIYDACVYLTSWLKDAITMPIGGGLSERSRQTKKDE